MSRDLERPREPYGHQGRLGESVQGPRQTRETERVIWTPRETRVYRDLDRPGRLTETPGHQGRLGET